jgi:hypothetical protein
MRSAHHGRGFAKLTARCGKSAGDKAQGRRQKHLLP